EIAGFATRAAYGTNLDDRVGATAPTDDDELAVCVGEGLIQRGDGLGELVQGGAIICAAERCAEPVDTFAQSPHAIQGRLDAYEIPLAMHRRPGISPQARLGAALRHAVEGRLELGLVNSRCDGAHPLDDLRDVPPQLGPRDGAPVRRSRGLRVALVRATL